MAYSDELDEAIRWREECAHRRENGVPNGRRLSGLTRPDERVPIEEALSLAPGDARAFRNAGELVTDDVTRREALSIHLFSTREIIIVNHTDCGMHTGTGEQVTKKVEQAAEVKLDEIDLIPASAALRPGAEEVTRWWRTRADLDEITPEQVRLLRDHPLIPSGTTVTGYVHDVHS